MKSNKAISIVKDCMLNHDSFSNWLGIELVEISEGYCRLKMKVRQEMTNGFNIAHGGIAYSLADSALAFASNSHGKKALSIETSISHLAQLKPGDEIYATANELSLSNTLAVYCVDIKNADGKLVATFKGTVYRTAKDWDTV